MRGQTRARLNQSLALVPAFGMCPSVLWASAGLGLENGLPRGRKVGHVPSSFLPGVEELCDTSRSSHPPVIYRH